MCYGTGTRVGNGVLARCFVLFGHDDVCGRVENILGRGGWVFRFVVDESLGN